MGFVLFFFLSAFVAAIAYSYHRIRRFKKKPLENPFPFSLVLALAACLAAVLAPLIGFWAIPCGAALVCGDQAGTWIASLFIR